MSTRPRSNAWSPLILRWPWWPWGSVPDETLGELARAYVVLRPGATATQVQIIEHCRPHLAAYKLPRSVRFVPDLPKTSTGKVMRRELKTLDR